jgi:hypothetical protein
MGMPDKRKPPAKEDTDPSVTPRKDGQKCKTGKGLI